MRARRHLALLLLCVPAVAAAQGAPAPDLEGARRHFMAATAAFQEGAYARARGEFEAAYAITRDPLLLYDVGESCERAGDTACALRSYRGYLAEMPEAYDRADVERTIARLEAAAAPPRPAAARAPAPAPPALDPRVGRAATAPAEDGPGKLRLAAWVTAASTIALATAGGFMTLQAKQREADVNQRLRYVDPQTGNPLSFPSVQAELDDLRSAGRRYETLSVVFYAAAAGAAVAAGTMFYLDHRRRSGEKAAKVRVVPQLGPKSAGLVAGVEF